MAYNILIQEFKETNPIITQIYQIPYNINDSTKIKVNRLLQEIRREK